MRLPTQKFKVLLYGPGVPENGVRARAYFEDGILVAQWHGHWFTIQAEQIGLRKGGYDGEQWLIGWQTPSGQVSLMLQDEDALRSLIERAPANIADKLRTTHRQHVDTGRGQRLLLGVALFLALLALALMVLLPLFQEPLSGWAAARLDVRQESALGERALADLMPTITLAPADAMTRAVDLIGIRLTVGISHRYAFEVVIDQRAFGLSLPGGTIIVSSGLLRRLTTAEEVAGVLAHLVAHVEQGHVLSRTIQSLGWRALIAAARGDVQAPVWDGFAQALRTLEYTEDMEMRADREALRLLRRAGVAADGLTAGLQRLHAATIANEGYAAMHPLQPRRLEALQQLRAAQGAYPQEKLQVGWPSAPNRARLLSESLSHRSCATKLVAPYQA